MKFIQAKTRKEARAAAPWACHISKVEGGFMAFESVLDYRTWRNQK